MLCRNHKCGCRPCLKLMPNDCKMMPVSAGLVEDTNPRAVPRFIHSDRPSTEARHTWNERNPPPYFFGECVLATTSLQE